MPEWRAEIVQRMRGSGLRASEGDIVEELSQHLDDRFAELRSQGLSEAEARAGALEELDGDELGRRMRAAVAPDPESLPIGVRSGADLLGSIRGDVRFAARMLRRTPGFTIVAALIIALGIGANTAIFSVVNAALLRPLPGVRSPSELAAVYTSDFSGPRYGSSSYPDFEAIRESGAFTSATAWSPEQFSITIGERSERVMGEVVSLDFFDVLGVSPAHGRFFDMAEGGAPGTAQSVVISFELWQRHFGGATDVLGRPLRVNGQVLTVAGVAPADFSGALRGLRMSLWVPMSAPEPVARFDAAERGNRGLLIFGRLPDGVGVEAAQARLDVLAAQLHAEYPGQWTDVNNRSRVLTVLPESEVRVPPQNRGPFLGMFGLLTAVVAIVLLIACTNVANLLLSRASARRAELGIRVALGATRGRIVRHLLAESLLLATLGGALGVLLAVWVIRLVRTTSIPMAGTISLDIALDVRVLAFAAAMTLLTGLLFGIIPAVQASRAPAPMMKGALTGRSARMRLRNALVVVQVAASLVLLAGAGLFLRSLLAAQRIDTGIVTDNMLLVPFDLTLENYSPEQAGRFFEDLQERVRVLPGVSSITLAEAVPLSLGWARRGIAVDGYTPAEGEDMEIMYNGVSPGYFEALGIRLVRGRAFTPADRTGAPGVMVVNEAFARRFWPGGGAIGKRVSLNGPEGPFAEVVGVVPDAKYRSLTEEPTPYMYYPYLQRPSRAMMMQVRTATDPERVVPALRREIRAFAAGLPVPEITTLRHQVGMATLTQRVAGLVLGVLGALALAIAGIGLYGVVAYAVVQRTREFGIRTALGAMAADVQWMVVREGLRLAWIGAVIGLGLSLALAQVVRSMLLVSPFDPLAFGTVVLVLLGAAAVASWIPARRATRVDPLLALRAE